MANERIQKCSDTAVLPPSSSLKWCYVLTFAVSQTRLRYVSAGHSLSLHGVAHGLFSGVSWRECRYSTAKSNDHCGVTKLGAQDASLSERSGDHILSLIRFSQACVVALG